MRAAAESKEPLSFAKDRKAKMVAAGSTVSSGLEIAEDSNALQRWLPAGQSMASKRHALPRIASHPESIFKARQKLG